MPAAWKKVIVSGSSAELANLNVNNQIVGSGSISAATSVGVITQQISASSAGTFLTGSFTGSFSGTVTGTISATASYAVSASYAYTASSAINASASLIAVSASYAYTASSAINATSALTASSADNFVVRNSLTASNALIQNTLTAQTLIVTTISSSVEYSSGSNIFGSSTANTQTMTGSVNITGSLNIVGPVSGSLGFTGSFSGSFSGAHTGSLFGTASNAFSASYAVTSSVAYSGTGSFTGSFFGAVSGSFSGSLFGTASNAGTASYAIQTIATLTQGTGITAFSYNGSSSVAISVSGAAALTTNTLPKWTGTAFANSNISDTGTAISVASNVPVTINNNLTVAGDLTVQGTASFQNTQNVLIADQFILLASGSNSLVDGGFIIATSTGPGYASGSAFYLESSSTGLYGRFAVAYNVSATASSVVADEYVNTTKISATNPSNATPPTYGSTTNGIGNTWINTTTDDIYIWA